MIYTDTAWKEAFSAPARTVTGRVIINSVAHQPSDDLVSIKVEKIPTNGSFFGYSICQKVTIELIDKYDDLDFPKGTPITVLLGLPTKQATSPTFYLDELVKDEVKNKVVITAYDLLYTAAQHLQSELEIEFPITLSAYADKVAEKLGATIEWQYTGNKYTDIEFTQETAPNFGGTETLRDVLNGIAAATGSICYMASQSRIVMKRLYNNPVGEITKDDYFDLKLGSSFTLTKLTHATELGENYIAGTEEGFNQVIRNNPFLENRADITTILDNLLALVKGTTLYHYSIKWRANPAFEIGDCINIDGNIIYYLGETITYNGGMSATSEWKDEKQDNPDGHPTTIGQAISQTFAKVDKVNNTIELLASEVSGNTSAISALTMDTDSIKASVSTLQTNLADAVEGVNKDIEQINKKVELAMTDEQVQIKIDKALENGVERVETSTGFTFNEEGLTVSKSGSEMTTTITEDGMTVYRDNTEVLVANNTGVIARNLHAETYLIIGNNSRFEDYTNGDYEARTGCFWIG